MSSQSSLFSSKLLAGLGLTTISLFLTVNPAHAFKVVDKSGFTDTDFQNLLRYGEFAELFVAEGRIGNNSLNTGERELGINTAITPNGSGFIGGTPVATGQRVWQNNVPVNFSLEYTGSQVNYIVDGKTLSSSNFTGAANNIFLRTRAAANSSLMLSNLVFNGAAISENLFSSVTGTGSDVDYLQISDITSAFTLTGQILMSWTGTQPPRNSALAYQIKVGSSPVSVPEPGTISGILLAGMAAVVYRKRKKSVNPSVEKSIW